MLTFCRSIIGSGLGGTLANPVASYPGYFAQGSIFARFPYLLPNIVCASIVVLSMIVGILFLEETHEDKRQNRDLGLMAGDWILGQFRSDPEISEKGGLIQESFHLLAEVVAEPTSEFSSTESSPALAPLPMSISELPAQNPTSEQIQTSAEKKQLAVHKVFSKQVVLIIVSYGLLA